MQKSAIFKEVIDNFISESPCNQQGGARVSKKVRECFAT